MMTRGCVYCGAPIMPNAEQPERPADICHHYEESEKARRYYARLERYLAHVAGSKETNGAKQ